MSGDPDQDFFADGLTEDIITALSRFRELLVISRNSTFVYKGKAVNVQEVAKAFGVHYVVEGSVRKIGNRVRITVQLIDAKTDRHVWAERYDRELADIFAMQDEVTSSIVATLSGRVEAAAVERVQRNPTTNMRAYEYLLAAKVLHHRATAEDNAEAQKLVEKALALDPELCARACLARLHCRPVLDLQLVPGSRRGVEHNHRGARNGAQPRRQRQRCPPHPGGGQSQSRRS